MLFYARRFGCSPLRRGLAARTRWAVLFVFLHLQNCKNLELVFIELARFLEPIVEQRFDEITQLAFAPELDKFNLS